MKGTLALTATAVVLNANIVSGLADSDSQFDPSQYATEDVIQRDIAIIGGGSSGTYSAITLRDKDQSVVVVEKESVLGGNINTYVDPHSQTSIEYGVQAFWNISVVRDLFAHFRLPLEPYQFAGGKTTYADFRTGDAVSVQSSTNYTAYAAQLERYPYLAYSWDLPNPVPSDLLLPFSQFVTKYSLQDVAFNVYFYCQGAANVLKQLTVNIFKLFDETYLDQLAGGASIQVNGDIFTKAQVELGPDALLSSTVVAAQRPNSKGGISLVVQTPNCKKLVVVSRLLITAPPLVDNLKPFDLDAQEQGIFSQWTYSAYYTMLVNNTSLSAGRYINAQTTLYNIPELPDPYQITQTSVPGIYYVWYASPYPQTDDDIKTNVTASIKKLVSAESAKTASPEFLTFRSHTPFKLVVSADAIASGFYRNLSALQGHRKTWYTGAAFISHNSAVIWNFTEALLPTVIAG